MDAISQSKSEKLNREKLDDAIDSKKEQRLLEAMAKYKDAHTPKVKEHKINRNDPCPCGSGKKYKNCCLSTGKYEKYK